MSSQYVIGQLVWAKLRGFPFWPARVVDPYEKPGMKKPRKKNCFCVHFFGSGDYAYISMDEMRPYFAFKEKLTPSSKKANFIEAIEEVDKYIVQNDSVRKMEAEFGIPDDESYGRWVKQSKADESASDYSDEVNEATPKAKKAKFEAHVGKSTNNVKSNVVNGNSRAKPASFSKAETLKEQHQTENPTSNFTTPSNVKPLNKRVGLIGIGSLGSILVKRLMACGHDLLLCSRSIKDEDNFETCEFVETPKELAEKCDIIFYCVSDLVDAKELLYDEETGVLDCMSPEKSYVEFSSLDLETTLKIQKDITQKGGRYLEAALCGSLSDAKEGKLVIMCAGDRSLFDGLLPCFQAIGHKAFFLGAAGNATKVRLAQQMLNGSVVACVAETLAFADRCGLNVGDFAELLEHTSVNCPLIQDVAKKISDEMYLPPSTKLDIMQKEMQYATALANGPLCQPTPMAALANQVWYLVLCSFFAEYIICDLSRT